MGKTFLAVLNMSVTGAVIIGAVICLRLLLKKLPRRYSYALWILPAVRLLCPVAVSSVFSLFNIFGAAVSDNRMEYISPGEGYFSENSVMSGADVTAVTEIPEQYDPALYGSNNVISPVSELPENLSIDSIPENEPEDISTAVTGSDTGDNISESSPNTAAAKFYAADIAAVIWLIGAAAVIIWAAYDYIKVRRRIAGAENFGEYFLCDDIETPFVFGVFRPGIYVPRGIEEGDLRCVLAHENAHIGRGDHIVKLLCVPLMALHWFNPMVWLGFRLMTNDMELSCDERALAALGTRERKSYANALLNMSMRQNRHVLGGALSFGESGIKGRIKGILSAKAPTKAAAAGAVVVIIAAAACLLTNAKGREEFPRLSRYDGSNLISPYGAVMCSSGGIEDLTEAFDRVSPVRVAAPGNEPENFIFSIAAINGSIAVAGPDMVRFYSADSEYGDREYYAQAEWSAGTSKAKKGYFSITAEEFEDIYAAFSKYSVHSFTGTVGTERDYTLSPAPNGEDYMYYDFSEDVYVIIPDIICGMEGNVKVHSDIALTPGDRVRVTCTGSEPAENVKVERENSRYYFNVKNEHRRVSLGVQDSVGRAVMQEIEKFDLQEGKRQDFFTGSSPEETIWPYSSFYTLEVKDGERYTRIRIPSPANENALSDKIFRYIAVEHSYMDLSGETVYYEVAKEDWEYITGNLLHYFDKPFPAGRYKRTEPNGGNTYELEISGDGTFTFYENGEEFSDMYGSMSGLVPGEEELSGYRLKLPRPMEYVSYKGWGTVAYEAELFSSFLSPAYGVYILEDMQLPEDVTEEPPVIALSEHSVLMPDNDIRTDENFSQMPGYYLSVSLPGGWTVSTPKRNEETYLPALFSPVNIYNEQGEFAGTAAMGYFTESLDSRSPERHKTVYQSLGGGWEEDYEVIGKEFFYENAVTSVDGNPSALYYTEIPGLYACVSFAPGAVTDDELRAIAASMTIYEFYDNEDELAESFVWAYYGGLATGSFDSRAFTDNELFREYLDLKLRYERSLQLDVGANEIWFSAEPHYSNRGKNQYGEQVRFYSLGFNVQSEYSQMGGGGDFEMVRKDGGWRIERALIYTEGDRLSLGMDIEKRSRPPVEYDLSEGIAWLREQLGERLQDSAYPTAEEAVRAYLESHGVTIASGVFLDETETENYRASHDDSGSLTAVIAVGDFGDVHSRYFITEETPEGYVLREGMEYDTQNSVFVAHVTSVESEGNYIIVPLEGQWERDSYSEAAEYSIASDLSLKVGDRVAVCYDGLVMESYPLRVNKFWVKKYEGSDFPEIDTGFATYQTVQQMTDTERNNMTDSYALISIDVPTAYEMSGNSAYSDGVKAVEIGAVHSAEGGYDPEGFKVDEAMGREVTVYEEQTGSGGLFDYMIHKSLPDHYSDDGVHETYVYVITRRKYMLSVHFTAEYYDRYTAERILSSITVSPCDSRGNMLTEPGFRPYRTVSQVGEKDEYDGIDMSVSYGYGLVTMELPENMEMKSSIGYIDGEKAFEISGALWKAEQGFNTDSYKVSTVSGARADVIEEKTGSGLYEYMLHSSMPTGEGDYENYMYIINRSGYMMTLSFLAEHYDRETAEYIIRSVSIDPCDERGNILTAEGEVSYKLHQAVQKVGNRYDDDDYPGIVYTDEDGYAAVGAELPESYVISDNQGYVGSEKVFVLGEVWHASQSYEPADYTQDMVSDREITVIEEETGTRGLYEYMLHSSVPDYYSDDRVAVHYTYVVRRGDYMMNIYFDGKYYDRETAEHILNSLEIIPFDPESVSYGEIQMQLVYSDETGLAGGYIVNTSDYDAGILMQNILTMEQDGGYIPVKTTVRTAAPEPAETFILKPGEYHTFTLNLGIRYDISPEESYRFTCYCWFVPIAGDSYNPKLSGETSCDVIMDSVMLENWLAREDITA